MPRETWVISGTIDDVPHYLTFFLGGERASWVACLVDVTLCFDSEGESAGYLESVKQSGLAHAIGVRNLKTEQV